MGATAYYPPSIGGPKVYCCTCGAELMVLGENASEACKKCFPGAALVADVAAIVDERNELRRLCGDMIATLTLPANREYIVKAGDSFMEMVWRWEAAFKRCSKETA